MKSNLKNVEFENYEGYVNDLVKSLSNFCSKSPLRPKVKIVKDLGKIYIDYGDDVMELQINVMENKKDVIKSVKNKLEPLYPIVYEKLTKVPNANEVEELMNKGKSLSEALETLQTIYNPRFVVKRVHNNFNEFDLYDMKEKCMYKYKSKIPVVVILEELKYKGRDAEIMENLTLLYKIGNN